MSDLDLSSNPPFRSQSLPPSLSSQHGFNERVKSIESTLYCTLQHLLGEHDAVKLQRDGDLLWLGRSVEALRVIDSPAAADQETQAEPRRKKQRVARESVERESGENSAVERVSSNNNKRKLAEQERKKVKRIADAYRESDDEPDGRNDHTLALENVGKNGDGLLWLRNQGLDLNLNAATKFMNNVRSICGPEALWELRTIIQYWRQSHRLDKLDSLFLPVGSQSTQLVEYTAIEAGLLEGDGDEPTSLADATEKLWHAFQATERVETFGLWHRIHQRLRLAFLWKRYEKVVSMMSEDFMLAEGTAAEHDRSSLRPETLAKDALFQKLYHRSHRTMQAIVANDDEYGEDVRDLVARDHEKRKSKFERQLNAGRRWSELMKRFKPPVIMGIVSTIPHSFFERMSLESFKVFCNAIEMYNPGVRGWAILTPVMNSMLCGQAPPDTLCGLEWETDESSIRLLNSEEQLELLTF